MMIDLETLMQAKERRLSVNTTAAEMSMYPTSGRPKTTQVFVHNSLLQRDRERKTHERVREWQYVTSLLETLVSPLSGGTELCQGVTTNDLQG